MMNFTLKYFKNNDFLEYFCFWVAEMLFSTIFHVFCFLLNFRDFSVFSISRETCHSNVEEEYRKMIWISCFAEMVVI